ncbi:MAG: 1-acyl-sn-glycerol-3-phosphate acyltransferase [Bradymonadaceae bacterium]
MNLDEIGTDRNWKRRALTIPLWLLLAIILPVVLPAVVLVLLIYDLIRPSRFSATRTAIFFTHFFVLEAMGLVIATWIWIRGLLGLEKTAYQLANRRLQRWWARGLFWGSVRIYSMNIDIDGLELLEDPTPSVVLSRHASTLDTMLPLAVVRELKLFRYVIKAELLASPALDVVGQRFPNVFVRRGTGDPEKEIRRVLALSQDLEENAAVMVYPEGTRFTAKKRERLLKKFDDDKEMLALAKSLKYTLPPLREGGVKLLMSTRTDVVFIAHRGIDRAGAMSDLIKGGMTRAHLEISIWRVPAEEVPRDADGVRDFLMENWRRIDRFVGEGYRQVEKASDSMDVAA